MDVNTNGTAKEESTPPSEPVREKETIAAQTQQQHAPPPPPPERTNDKDKEKPDKDKSGGELTFKLALWMS